MTLHVVRPRRRRFLQAAAAVPVGYWASGLPAADPAGPNEKLQIGIIGVSGRGAANMAAVAGETIVALCDVDSRRMGAAVGKYPQATNYDDWRGLVDHKGLDAVVISTTDHTHAPACVWAMNRGLSVYCEKPLAHSVYEARVVQEKYLASRGRLATQMGTQIHATDNYRRVVELIQSGAIGSVSAVHVWCNRVGSLPARPAEEVACPPELNWDLWLGPAPARSYHPSYPTGGCMNWEQHWDWGNGCLGDMGSHLIDLPFWALGLRDPVRVEADGEPRSEETYPRWLVARWEHPARGSRGPVSLTWYDGGKRPPSPPGHDLNTWGIGVLFAGDKGQLLADYGRRILLPEDRFRGFTSPPASIPPSLGHHQEWIHAAKTGGPTLCNFDDSGKLVEVNLLGAVAFRAGMPLEWDPIGLRATNCPEASRFIRREYRAGWVLDG